MKMIVTLVVALCALCLFANPSPACAPVGAAFVQSSVVAVNPYAVPVNSALLVNPGFVGFNTFGTSTVITGGFRNRVIVTPGIGFNAGFGFGTNVIVGPRRVIIR